MVNSSMSRRVLVAAVSQTGEQVFADNLQHGAETRDVLRRVLRRRRHAKSLPASRVQVEKSTSEEQSFMADDASQEESSGASQEESPQDCTPGYYMRVTQSSTADGDDKGVSHCKASAAAKGFQLTNDVADGAEVPPVCLGGKARASEAESEVTRKSTNGAANSYHFVSASYFSSSGLFAAGKEAASGLVCRDGTLVKAKGMGEEDEVAFEWVGDHPAVPDDDEEESSSEEDTEDEVTAEEEEEAAVAAPSLEISAAALDAEEEDSEGDVKAVLPEEKAAFAEHDKDIRRVFKRLRGEAVRKAEEKLAKKLAELRAQKNAAVRRAEKKLAKELAALRAQKNACLEAPYNALGAILAARKEKAASAAAAVEEESDQFDFAF
jgi:hypothetical protein